ncbi:MAG TPA: MBL fold metallo-hydrolase [Candidatus Mediterraneibacter excrementigallinarum]|nr:MBL fold metallo-hydrolase [Candidatus Mediterraneibacter excrementigallinarum]
MKLFIAGGCREHGRNSFLLDDRDECLLIDCGKGEGDFCFPQLNKEQIRKIRCLFLTHSHKDHSGGIEWLIENGFHGSIISTEETRTQCKIDYESWNILPVAEQMPLFRQLDPSLCIRYGRTGHCIGSIWFLIEWNHKKIIFTGDYKEKSPVYISDRIRNISADCAVIDCAYGNMKIDSVKLEEELLNTTEKTIHAGRSVYMPIPKFGRGLEIIQTLNKTENKFLVYADRNIYEQAKQRNSLWMNTAVVSVRPFETWNGEPAVLFVSDPQLRKKENYELAVKIYKDGGAILLTGHVYPNTGAEQLLDKRYAGQILYPVHMNYHEVCDFVKANHISSVVLNHYAGEINDKKHIALDVAIGTTIEF